MTSNKGNGRNTFEMKKKKRKQTNVENNFSIGLAYFVRMVFKWLLLI